MTDINMNLRSMDQKDAVVRIYDLYGAICVVGSNYRPTRSCTLLGTFVCRPDTRAGVLGRYLADVAGNLIQLSADEMMVRYIEGVSNWNNMQGYNKDGRYNIYEV